DGFCDVNCRFRQPSAELALAAHHLRTAWSRVFAVDRGTLDHRHTHQHRRDRAHLSPRHSADTIMATSVAWSSLGDCDVVWRDGRVWLVCDQLCELSGNLWIVGSRDCVVGMAIPGVNRGSDRRRIQRAHIPETGDVTRNVDREMANGTGAGRRW